MKGPKGIAFQIPASSFGLFIKNMTIFEASILNTGDAMPKPMKLQ